jgi:3-oxoacyl-[acyl-carrier protein] reductase
MSVDLSNQSVLVTGASGRLGRELTAYLLNAGATVVGADIQASDLVPDRLHFIEADVLQEKSVSDLVSSADARVGGIDALVHTVGMWAGGPLAETDRDDFDRMLQVNLTSAFLCFREAVRNWQRNERGGRLVAIASMQGAEGGAAQQAAYSASKAGVIRLVEATAREFSGTGISAAAVAPSMILYGEEAPGTQGVPVARIAEVCAYLATEAGAAHNGTVIRVYGTMLG